MIILLQNIELYDEDITLLTMHDLVHDLARTAMDNEILVISKGDNVQGSCYHYALLNDCSKPLVSELSKIRALRFMKCDKSTVYDAAFSSANSLRVLDLSECIIHKLPDSIGVLKQLRIPGSIGTIDSLKILDINGCINISKVPQLGSNAISLPYFGVRPGDGDSSSNLVLLQHIDPVVLKITELENVKSVEEAQRINLTGKQKLEFLELEWTRDGERFVDDKVLMENLVPPSTLKKLEICGYNGVSFPAWLVLDQLPNLEHLVLRGMANLKEWNTSYSSGEEHMIGQLEIHDCPMLRMKPLPPKTKKWKISNSANVLSSWEECTGPHTNATSSFSAVTTELWVDNCNVPLHQWSLLQHFPGLTTLVILGSVDLTGSPEVIRHLSSLQILRLEDQDLEELPKWLNENMWQLTNLELIGWKNMASLPHWFGELTSLKELSLLDCDVLCSLPESIQQLTRLEILHISGCPELNHLGERVCLLPSSLEALLIWSCNGIKCLPEGMEQLTNLQTLDIYDCPDLKQWCELEENMMKLDHIKKKVTIMLPVELSALGQEDPDQARRDAPTMGPVVGAVDSSCSSSPRCPSCLARKLVVSKRGLAIAERGEGIR
ncbi:hypothetical protein ACQ4PT_046636 [Festuca glaucescens]